jgi:hypothetical protein
MIRRDKCARLERLAQPLAALLNLNESRAPSIL